MFEAVLAALGLPRGWRMRLARAFGSAEMLAAALADLANPPEERRAAEPVAALVADGDLDGARRPHRRRHGRGRPVAIRRPHAAGNRAPPGRKGRAAQRAPVRPRPLRRSKPSWRSRCRSTPPPLRSRPSRKSAGLSLGTALGNSRPGSRRVAPKACRCDAIRYDAAFGRPLDYYTGLVFEISAGGWRSSARPAAAATTGC